MARLFLWGDLVYLGWLVINNLGFVFGAGGGDLEAEVVGDSPMDCVFDYALDVGVMEGGAGFVAGLEVKDLSRATDEAGSASEDIAVLKPAAEDEGIRLRDIKRLAVKLILLEDEVVGNSRGDGVCGHKIPDDLLLISAPGEDATCTDNASEGFGEMCGVESDKAHFTRIYTVADFCNEGIVNKLVRHVSPPNKDIGAVK